MKYSIVLSEKNYAALRDKLEEHTHDIGRMYTDFVLVVDETGREIVEEYLPGRIKWESRRLGRRSGGDQ